MSWSRFPFELERSTAQASRAALEEAFRSGSWGDYDGYPLERLRGWLSERLGGAQVHLCASGTVAMELALRALPVGAGDEVLLAGYDYPGNFRAIERVGARPVLVDLEAEGWRIAAESLASSHPPSIKAVILSHLHGTTAGMKLRTELAKQRGLWVIEDACQAQGAVDGGRSAGCYGDVVTWSFGGSKLLTSGRGGAVATVDARIAQRIKNIVGQGSDAYPMSNLQAAVLSPQLESLDQLHAQRRETVERLESRLRQSRCLRLAPRDPDDSPAFYHWGARLLAEDDQQLAVARRSLGDFLSQAGIPLGDGFAGFGRRSSSRCRRWQPLVHATRAAVETVLIHHSILRRYQSNIESIADKIMEWEAL
ncbi:MAG: DegT/DnrJ/EryC1/StrS family aminotransferase [Pirellulaceae bacterium]